eukprot:COSAG02_NODE_48404_length_334_cov_0.642553_1_plen_37_part_10
MTGKVSNPRSGAQDPGLMSYSVLEFTTGTGTRDRHLG